MNLLNKIVGKADTNIYKTYTYKMFYGAGCNYGSRTFRLCLKNSAENQLSAELKRQFHASHFKESKFSLKAFFDRCSQVKSLQKLRNTCNEKLVILGEIFAEQFNFYASQRVRRMSQIWNFYTQLYSEKNIKQIVSHFYKSLHGRTERLTFLLGIALFSWEKEKITDDDILNNISELEKLKSGRTNNSGALSNNQELTQILENEGWEPIITKERVQLWRRKPYENSYLYEYKIFGTFFDVPARAFFRIQNDLEYRKKWDKLVIKLEIIDEDKKSHCEVVHWVMHYPYPMYSRDYVYIRRSVVDPKTNTMVLVNRAVDHPACPVSRKFVRVQEYMSQLVIRPHSNFDDNGFDYILTYFDDPKAKFPTMAYNWMASSGVPEFVERLHDAALELQEEEQIKRRKASAKTFEKPGASNSNQPKKCCTGTRSSNDTMAYL